MILDAALLLGLACALTAVAILARVNARGRRANARLTAERDQAQLTNDELIDVLAKNRAAMRRQRINTNTLLGRIKQLEGDNEAIELTRAPMPVTPKPGEIRAVIETAESILRGAEGGESRA